MTTDLPVQSVAVRSFVRRNGRLTPAQRTALEQLLPRHGVPPDAVLDYAHLFGRSAARCLEIGFGDGQSLLQMAAARPDMDFVGIEVHDPGVGRALLGIEQAALRNVRVVHGDAVEVLANRVAPHSLDRVLLFFPDPWPKKRHHKRRIVQPDFARLLASRLRRGGVLHAATDWQPLAEHMLAVLEAEAALRNQAGPGRFAATAGERPQTKFERRGIRLGHAVWDLCFER